MVVRSKVEVDAMPGCIQTQAERTQRGQAREVGDHRAGVDRAQPVQAQHGDGRRDRRQQGHEHRQVALPERYGR